MTMVSEKLHKDKLRKHVVAGMNKEEGDLTLSEDFIIEQVIAMLADFDERLVQYPLYSLRFILDCVRRETIDVLALNTMLETLRTVDQLKGK